MAPFGNLSGATAVPPARGMPFASVSVPQPCPTWGGAPVTSPRDSVVKKPPGGLAPVVEQNIEALVKRRREDESRRGWQERLADGIARFTGSMPFVYIHVVLFGAWILANTLTVPWLPIPRFDPSLVILAMAASVEAIFLSTFVLINQNRMAALADRRADLDLQVSLLSEHEITRLITMVRGIALKMGVEESHDPELHELARDVAPEKVMDRIEASERELRRSAK